MKKTLVTFTAVAGLAVGLAASAEHKSGKTADHPVPNHSHHTHAYSQFPPVNSEGNIEFHPEFYWSNTDYPYVFHDGYWWYPSEDATLLEGYQPVIIEGKYWYPSMQHPHVFYVTDEPVVYVYPHLMDKPMDDAISSPMEKVHPNAPTVK